MTAIKKQSRTRRLSPVTPGELLWEEFMVPMGITRYRLAKDINVPAQRIGDIILGKRAITTDTALRLSRYFGLSDEYWIKAQYQYELEVSRSAIEAELRKILPITRQAR
jgi:addiction module HigA family antidote